MSIAMTSGAVSQPAEPIVTAYFGVRLDNYDLGSWTEVDLGGVEVAMETLEEGGNAGFHYQLPGRLNYHHIKLTRVVGPSSSQVSQWFMSMTGAITRTTGEIVGYSTDGRPAISWKFVEAVPVSWNLPTLGVDGPKGFTETLEIAHQGFIS